MGGGESSPPEKRSGKGQSQLSAPSTPGRELCAIKSTGGAVFAQGVEEAENQGRRECLERGGEGREGWGPMLTPSKGIKGHILASVDCGDEAKDGEK